jgi:hypothetical protein
VNAETFARTAAAQRRSVDPLTALEGLGGSPFFEAYAGQDIYVAAVYLTPVRWRATSWR